MIAKPITVVESEVTAMATSAVATPTGSAARLRNGGHAYRQCDGEADEPMGKGAAHDCGLQLRAASAMGR